MFVKSISAKALGRIDSVNINSTFKLFGPLGPTTKILKAGEYFPPGVSLEFAQPNVFADWVIVEFGDLDGGDMELTFQGNFTRQTFLVPSQVLPWVTMGFPLFIVF